MTITNQIHHYHYRIMAVEINLNELLQIVDEVQQPHRKEQFWRLLATPTTGGIWPENYDEILGVARNPVVDRPRESMPTFTYILNFEAAVHAFRTTRIKKLFSLTNTQQIREISARFPDTGAGLQPCVDTWRHFETTSGLYTEIGENQTDQLRMTSTILSTLIHLTKEGIRQHLPSYTLDADYRPPQPMTEATTLASEYNIDTFYVHRWNPKLSTYTKQSIDQESAKTFSRDSSSDPMGPYTGAGRCVKCKSIVAPSSLKDHLETCHIAATDKLLCLCDETYNTTEEYF